MTASLSSGTVQLLQTHSLSLLFQMLPAKRRTRLGQLILCNALLFLLL